MKKRKLPAILCSAVLAASLALCSVPAAAEALYTLQHTVGKMASLPVTDQDTCLSYKEPSSNYKKVGDTCRDGYVNVTDALYIIQYSVGKIDDFPYGL